MLKLVYFLKNDKPKIVMPSRFSQERLDYFIKEDPQAINKELASKYK